MRNKKRLWQECIQLITLSNGEDEAGYPASPVILKNRELLANKRSIKSSEFYAANQNGMKVDVTFEIHLFEYAGEQLLEHEGKRYEVIRTYETSPELIELTCSDLSHKGVQADG